MRAFIMFVLALAVLMPGCRAPREAAPVPSAAAEPPIEIRRAPVPPPLSGVRVRIGDTWLDLFEPPTIEQAALQAGETFRLSLNEADFVKVLRADGQVFTIPPRSYATFMLTNRDVLYVPKRILP